MSSYAEQSSRANDRLNLPPYQRRVIVKLANSALLPFQSDAEAAFAREGGAELLRRLGPWPDLKKAFTAATLQPVFKQIGPKFDELEVKLKRVKRKASVDLRAYFACPAMDSETASAIAQALNDKNAWPGVEVSYVESGPTPPPTVDYLNPARIGFDAAVAWREPGGTGSGGLCIDIEEGWDLTDAGMPVSMDSGLIFGRSIDREDHGTAVVSVIAGRSVALPNGTNVTGIARDSVVKGASKWHRDDVTVPYICSTADALDAAFLYLEDYGKVGDVVLIETQSEAYLPSEAEPAVFDAIRNLTDHGYVVVEAAGNAGERPSDKGLRPGEPPGQGVNIDGYLIRSAGGNGYADSGAIMVGAATPDPDHPWFPLTNFGSRIDCFAWGRGISCAGQGRGGNFGGTSGASAIIAGIILCIQGIAEEKYGRRYTADDLRQLFKIGGTPSSTAGTNPIGVMPNLATIVPAIDQIEPALAV